MIFLSQFLAKFLNYICTLFAKYRWARKLGIMVYTKNRRLKTKASSFRLYIETYFEMTISVFLAFYQYSEDLQNAELSENFRSVVESV
jgi:hypothetical protein